MISQDTPVHQLPMGPKQVSPSCFLTEEILLEVTAPASHSFTNTFRDGWILQGTDADMHVPNPNFPRNPRVTEL